MRLSFLLQKAPIEKLTFGRDFSRSCSFLPIPPLLLLLLLLLHYTVALSFKPFFLSWANLQIRSKIPTDTVQNDLRSKNKEERGKIGKIEIKR